MRCDEISFGSYDCSYSIMPPFKCGFGNEFKYVSVDKCLIKEIIDLWEQGICTTGCCCGHGDNDKAFIGVEFEDIPKMKALGYKVHFNPCRPDDEDSFMPKTIFNYGEIQKGFNKRHENRKQEWYDSWHCTVCPCCGSTSVYTTTTLIYGPGNKSTNHCSDCGYMWEDVNAYGRVL